MALIVGTNSWIDRTDANLYFADRIATTAWDALADADKDKHLVTAYYWIFNDPAYTAPADSTVDAVRFGQSEGALFLAESYNEWNKRDKLLASGVKDFKYGRWEEMLDETEKPSWVKNYFEQAGFFTGGLSCVDIVDDNNLY